jgi:hypothetical protein
MKCNLAIPDGGKLAAQKIWRCAVLRDGDNFEFIAWAAAASAVRDLPTSF